jgi:hypothetical protein
MGPDQVPMGIIRHKLHLAQAILSKVASLFLHLDSLVDKQQLAMRKVLLGAMGHIHLHNKVILSSKLQTMQVMAIKGLKILLMVVPLHMVHQPASRVMLNQHQLNQAMISQSHNLLVMELLRQLLQLVMGKLCLHSLAILNMTQPRCMLRHAESDIL